MLLVLATIGILASYRLVYLRGDLIRHVALRCGNVQQGKPSLSEDRINKRIPLLANLPLETLCQCLTLF